MPDFKYHVFLSHSTADKPAVEELAVRLRLEGIEPWLDKWNLIPGQTWQPAIEDALAGSATCAVFIGSGGFGAWQNEEMRAAINRRVADSGCGFRVIPVLLPMAERPGRGKLPTFLTATTWVEFRKSLDDEEAFRRLTCGIRGVEPGATDGPTFEGRSPYRGLEVFDVEHAPFFFGREALTEWMVDTLRPRADGRENRFLAILSASGGGKSSLARAGLIAALKRGALEGSAAWPVVILKPGHDPIESLAVALAGLDGTKPSPVAVQGLMSSLRSEENTLHLTTRLALRDAQPAARLVVLVDQCEEVFTLCDEEKARKPFFDNLLYAATVSDGRTIVLLTMRADFYGKCAPYPALSAAMSGDQLLVGPMTRDELRRAIERPALLAGGEFEPGLVEVLLQDVAGQPGSLPLLQFTLMELWQRREGRRLTVAAYKALGELQGALKNRADDVLSQFDEAHREICRRIFLRLTQPGEGSEDTKRRASFGELVPAGTDPLAVDAVVRRLADARLITTQSDPKSAGLASVEVAHEALIRGWTQLRQWIDADREGLRLQRQITEAAREWETHGREGSFLFSGTRLAQAEEWARTHRTALDDREAAFLSASLRSRRRGKIALAALGILALGSALAAWEWRHSQKAAEFNQYSRTVLTAMEEARRRAIDGHWNDAISKLEAADDPLKTGHEYKSLKDLIRGALKSYKEREADRLHQEKERENEEHDRKIVARLDEAHLMADEHAAGGSNTSRTVPDQGVAVAAYRQAFREGGIDIDGAPPEKVVEFITAKLPPIREALVATLDDWAALVDPPENARLRAIAREVDPDTWSNAIRDAEAKGDTRTLLRLAQDAEVANRPAARLAHLGSVLGNAGEFEAATEVLRRAQQFRPHDFWINEELAFALRSIALRSISLLSGFDEAIRYYSIGVSIRPQSSGANGLLGSALARGGRVKEGLIYCDEAIRLDGKSATAYWCRGIVYGCMKNYEKAINEYSEAIRMEPKFVLAYVNRGSAYSDKGEYGQAIEDYDEAIRLDPKQSLARSSRAAVRRIKGDVDVAIEDHDAAIRLDPKSSYARNYRGVERFFKGDLDGAIADFNEAIRIDRTYTNAYFNRGVVYIKKNDYHSALVDFNEAIRLDPKSGDAHRERGYAHVNKDEYDLAIADFDEAIRLGSKDLLRVYNSRGVARFRRGDYDGAITDYDEALRLNPEYAMAYFNRGRARAAKQGYDSAIADYDEAIRQNPKFALAHLNRGIACEGKHDYDEAIVSYTKVIGLDPRSATAYNSRGNARGMKRDYDGAIADYTEAIKSSPKYAEAYNNRGFYHALKHEYDPAIADYTEAIRIDTGYAVAYRNRGTSRASKRDHDGAIADFVKAIDLSPRWAGAFGSRGESWNAKGEYGMAIASFDDAIRLDSKYRDAYNGRARARYARREYEKAISDYDAAIHLDEKDSSAHQERAWIWATCPDEKFRDGKKAVDSATRACKLTEWGKALFLDTLAAAYAEAGDFDEAIKREEKALELLDKGDETTQNGFTERLNLYRAKKPYRRIPSAA